MGLAGVAGALWLSLRDLRRRRLTEERVRLVIDAAPNQWGIRLRLEGRGARFRRNA